MLAEMIMVFIVYYLDFFIVLKKLILKILFLQLFWWLTVELYGGVANILWLSHNVYTVFVPQKQTIANSYK